jgi:hypothetical protein
MSRGGMIRGMSATNVSLVLVRPKPYLLHTEATMPENTCGHPTADGEADEDTS